MNRKYTWILALPFLLVSGLACSVPGLYNETPDDLSTPSVAISSPTANQQLAPGEEILVQSVAVDTAGVVRVELIVDGQVVWVDANASPEPNAPFIVAQPWTPASSGTYQLQVRAYNNSDAAGESKPLTVEVVDLTADQEPASTPTDVSILASASTATPTPTLTSTSGPPTPTDTPGPPTATPTQTSTPTATPAPQDFEPTGLEPEGRLNEIWLELGGGDSRLGYPTSPEVNDRDYAQQRFEKGLMFWWDNPETPDYIWVIDSAAEDMRSGATSNLYPDTWDEEEDSTYSCDAARDSGPIRGFGKVWCQHPELETRLGYPVQSERGSGGSPPFARVQLFQGGVIVHSPLSKQVFVLFAQGDWQRFSY